MTFGLMFLVIYLLAAAGIIWGICRYIKRDQYMAAMFIFAVGESFLLGWMLIARSKGWL